MRTTFAASLVLLCLAVAAPAAHADAGLVVLGPIGTGDLAGVKAALANVKRAKLGTKIVDIACTVDPGCLTKAGSELGAQRILAVTLASGQITLTLVDVPTNLLLGTRDIEIPSKKAMAGLAATVSKFVEETPVSKAKALFAEGNQHYNLGEFTQALDKYKLAYRVKPLPAFQFNIAQCHRKLSQHKEAIAMYQAYLVDVPDAQNKPMVDSLIAESKKAIADEAAADDVRERERLATERSKAEEARKIKEAEAVAKTEAAKAEQARIAAESARDKDYNRHPARKFMLVTGALGLATAGVGGYFAVQERDAQRAFDDLGCGDPSTLLGQSALATCVEERDRGEKNALFGNVLIGSGAALLVTSALVFIIDPGNVERPRSGPQVSVTANAVKVVFAW
jgi:tetratricopeptide (TPR) repeat protein